MRLLFILALLLLPLSAIAAPYQIIKDKSTIKFSGTHAGNNFEGQFESWDADIVFDVDNLASSFANITIDMSAAKTGNAMYDGTLPSADWFDVNNHPTAIFKSTSFEEKNDGYVVTGDLILRGVTKPISFDFNLEGDSPVNMTASFPINRLDFNIGKESDGLAEWVSDAITLSLDITAIKQ